MERRFFTIALSFLCSLTFAQIIPGAWRVSAGLCYDQDKFSFPQFNGTDFTKLEQVETEAALKLDVGYAFRENSLVGLKVGYETYKDVGENLNLGTGGIATTTDYDRQFLIAPTYSCFHFCAPKFAFKGEVSVPFSFSSGTSMIEFSDGPNPPEMKMPNSFGIGAWLTPSLVWFPKNNWSLEASVGSLGYFRESYEEDGEDFVNSNLKAKIWPLRPHLTLSYYFNNNGLTQD